MKKDLTEKFKKLGSSLITSKKMFLIAGMSLFIGSGVVGYKVAKLAQEFGFSKAGTETYLTGEFKDKYPFTAPILFFSQPSREISYYLLDVE